MNAPIDIGPLLQEAVRGRGAFNATNRVLSASRPVSRSSRDRRGGNWAGRDPCDGIFGAWIGDRVTDATDRG